MVDTNRIALVTGANKGIGLEIARQLAQAGVFVIIGARDLGRAQTAVEDLSYQGLAAQSVPIDLNDPASIAAAAETIRTEHGRLDILVNNAGIVDGEDGPPTVSSPEAARRILDTNFVGTLAVTQAMLPLLRKSPAARIVNLSSSLGSLTLNGDPTSPYYSARLIGYNVSKAALNMLTVQLAQELRDTPIVVNCPESGLCENRSDRAQRRHNCRRGRETAGRVCAARRGCRFWPVRRGERPYSLVSLPLNARFRSRPTDLDGSGQVHSPKRTEN
jgi:NAD(P)-dependent dehydrogenase (short-subunit alcohol dehydrogenase family)